QHQLAALGLRRRGRDRDLAAELVGGSGLALADALDLGGVKGIDLGAALAMVLEADAQRQVEERAEAALEVGLALDLAVDIADDPTQAGAQELELSSCPPELMRVAVAADHDGGALGDPGIALTQLDAGIPRE